MPRHGATTARSARMYRVVLRFGELYGPHRDAFLPHLMSVASLLANLRDHPVW